MRWTSESFVRNFSNPQYQKNLQAAQAALDPMAVHQTIETQQKKNGSLEEVYVCDRVDQLLEQNPQLDALQYVVQSVRNNTKLMLLLKNHNADAAEDTKTTEAKHRGKLRGKVRQFIQKLEAQDHPSGLSEGMVKQVIRAVDNFDLTLDLWRVSDLPYGRGYLEIGLRNAKNAAETARVLAQLPDDFTLSHFLRTLPDHYEKLDIDRLPRATVDTFPPHMQWYVAILEADDPVPFVAAYRQYLPDDPKHLGYALVQAAPTQPEALRRVTALELPLNEGAIKTIEEKPGTASNAVEKVIANLQNAEKYAVDELEAVYDLCRNLSEVKQVFQQLEKSAHNWKGSVRRSSKIIPHIKNYQDAFDLREWYDGYLDSAIHIDCLLRFAKNPADRRALRQRLLHGGKKRR